VQIRKLAGTAVTYSIDSGGKSFQISSPDASCRLSFSANSKALLANQYTQMQLPAHELAKLAGPAVLDGQSLQVSVFNGTDWHLSEIAIALTLVSKSESDASVARGSGKLVAAAIKDPVAAAAKPPDATTLYRVRAAAAPATTTLFRAPLESEIGADQEWHWAIVEAKGYPPQRVVSALSGSR
jgi:hypothetical protein